MERGKIFVSKTVIFRMTPYCCTVAIPWERAFLWFLHWKSCRNAISGIFSEWSQASMGNRQANQIEPVVSWHVRKVPSTRHFLKIGLLSVWGAEWDGWWGVGGGNISPGQIQTFMWLFSHKNNFEAPILSFSTHMNISFQN